MMEALYNYITADEYNWNIRI